MVNLRGFRKANGLRQEVVANFLGVDQSFISQVESGKRDLPEDKLEMLKKNDKGWNTDMLGIHQVINNSGDHIEQRGGKGNVGKTSGESSPELLALRKEVELLRAQIDDLKQQNQQYWELIRQLTSK